MSPSVLTFESIIGNAVNVTRRVVLTMDFFHWMTTANSDSVYGCSVVHKKDTHIAIGESLLSRAASGSSANTWSPHGDQDSTRCCSRRISAVSSFSFNSRINDSTTVPSIFPPRQVLHLIDERDGLCPQYPGSSSLV